MQHSDVHESEHALLRAEALSPGSASRPASPPDPHFSRVWKSQNRVASHLTSLTRTNASIAGHQARLRQLLTVDLQFRLESEAARKPHETTEVVKRRAHGLGVCVAQACPLQVNKM